VSSPCISRLSDPVEAKLASILMKMPYPLLVFLENSKAEFCQDGTHPDQNVSKNSFSSDVNIVQGEKTPLIIVSGISQESIYQAVMRLACCYASDDQLDAKLQDIANRGESIVNACRDELKKYTEGSFTYRKILADFQLLVHLSKDVKNYVEQVDGYQSPSENLMSLFFKLKLQDVGDEIAYAIIGNFRIESARMDTGLIHIMAYYFTKHVPPERRSNFRHVISEMISFADSTRQSFTLKNDAQLFFSEINPDSKDMIFDASKTTLNRVLSRGYEDDLPDQFDSYIYEESMDEDHHEISPPEKLPIAVESSSIKTKRRGMSM
jgi:hypothetical protein